MTTKIETKARAYDEAVERAKSAIKDCGDNKGRIAMIESIFPELKESEDERIRKEMITAFSRLDKYEGLTDFERTLADICIGWIGEELGWKQYIKDNADVLLKIAIKKFNSIQDAPFEHKSAAWSEEDSKRIDYICDFIWKNRKGDTDEIYQQEQDVKWLKSIKDRIGG